MLVKVLQLPASPWLLRPSHKRVFGLFNMGCHTSMHVHKLDAAVLALSLATCTPWVTTAVTDTQPQTHTHTYIYIYGKYV